jgi:hypothetical protein
MACALRGHNIDMDDVEKADQLASGATRRSL